MFGDQWICPCGTHNIFLRANCRDCGIARGADAKTETAEEIIGRGPSTLLSPAEHRSGALNTLLDRVACRARDIYYRRNPAPGLKPWDEIGAIEQNVWKPYAEAAIEAAGEICAADVLRQVRQLEVNRQ
jgi:hypothetical protein